MSAYNGQMRPLKLICVTWCLFAAACVGGGQNVNNKPAAGPAATQANSARTNPEELGLLIRIPYETEDVVWKRFDDTRVIAVLRFSKADAEKVVEEAAVHGAGENVTLPVESWFPDELIAQGDMSGNSALRGVSYSANGFAQEPFISGRATRIEGTDFFVLEMTAR